MSTEIKNSLKRKREEIVDAEVKEEVIDWSIITNICHYQEELTLMNSEEFVCTIIKIERIRRLTKKESNVVKTIRRRINNRESARSSRDIKRNYQYELNDKVNALTEQVHLVKEQLCSYRATNEALKNEILYLEQLCKGDETDISMSNDITSSSPTVSNDQQKETNPINPNDQILM